jgi:hypothetical protein
MKPMDHVVRTSNKSLVGITYTALTTTTARGNSIVDGSRVISDAITYILLVCLLGNSMSPASTIPLAP